MLVNLFLFMGDNILSFNMNTKKNLLKRESFNYFLPQSLIAQTPVEPRDSSKLLVLDKSTGKIVHTHFYNIIEYLNPGDCLVLNNSKVLPARIYGKKQSASSTVEFLLLSQVKTSVWKTLSKPGKKAKIGCEFSFGDGILKATVEDITETGERIIRFNQTDNFYERLEKIGQMPLPPYIKTHLKDNNRYQTVYAKDRGSAAAPTAGLHFTDELINKIKSKGVNIAFVTLHVGLGTFRPVKEEIITNHKMHSEHYTINSENAEIISKAKKSGNKVIAVGTTSCRTLESAMIKHQEIVPCSGDTDIFIYPGYNFKITDGLITNFHLPESTLIMLVSALAGYENTMNSYKIAVESKYRFFSFGDAMMII